MSQDEQQQGQDRAPVPYDRFAAVVAERNELRKRIEAESTAQKTAGEDRAKLEADLTAARLGESRLRAALGAGLPLELADRLQGADVEALAQDAARLAELVRPASAGVPPAIAGAPARLAIDAMTPAQIREHEAALWEQATRR